MSSVPPGPPFTTGGDPDPVDPEAGTGNPYANLEPMDLSSATFEKLASLDQATVDSLIAKVEGLTQSNLTSAAKWNNILQVVDSALRSAGLVARIVAAT